MRQPVDSLGKAVGPDIIDGGSFHRRLLRYSLSGRAQPLGGGVIYPAVAGEHDTIVLLGRIARNQSVRDIESHPLGIALRGVAEAAAARQFEPNEIATRDALPAFGADRLARDKG